MSLFDELLNEEKEESINKLEGSIGGVVPGIPSEDWSTTPNLIFEEAAAGAFAVASKIKKYSFADIFSLVILMGYSISSIPGVPVRRL